jgi:hypothetical protein
MRFPDTKLALLWVGLPLSALGLAIVLGVDPDPFIRSQLLRDASRYFGGGDQ